MKVLVLNNRYPSTSKPFVASYVKSLGEVFRGLGLNVEYLVDTGNSDSKLGQVVDLLRYNLKVLISSKLVKADILVINHFQLYWGALKKRVSNKQTLIFHWHGSEIKGSHKFQNFEEWNSDPLIINSFHVFPSKYFKRAVLAKVPDIKNWKVIPTGGVDTEQFNIERRESNDYLTLGFAGHLRKEKGVDFLIRLIEDRVEVEKLAGKKVRFAAIEYGDPTGDNIARLKAFDIVDLYKPMLKAEMPEYYNKVDLLIFPTRSESLGLVPIEAMACGVPAVCPNDFACPEYCQPSLSGELFQYDDYESFKEAVKRGISNLGNYNPREIVNEKYSTTVTQAEYSRLLNSIT